MASAQQKLLTIIWTTNPGAGYADLFPRFWFSREGTWKLREHEILSPRNIVTIAKCGLTVRGSIATLDYGTPYEQSNRDVSYIGVMKIRFMSRSRKRVRDVWWRDKGARKFEHYPVLINPLADDIEADEGDPRLVTHLRRERSAELRRRKIAAIRRSGRSLECEACRMLFEKKYGALGKGFCEVHHRKGLAAGGRALRSLADLAILCSNCHRMIHKTKPMMSVKVFAKKHVKTAA